jgi:glycosyltransferase involved in cell wall biosynthesis
MRILTVCTSTNVFGAEAITLKMLEGFKKRGHQQLAVTSIWTDGEFTRRLANIGISEVRLSFGFFSKRMTLQSIRWTAKFASRIPWLWIRWRRTVRTFNPDVIVFTSTRLALPVLPLLDVTPAFLVEHANLTETAIRRRMHKAFSRKLRAIVAVSEFTKEYTVRTTGTRIPVHVIKNGPFSAEERDCIIRLLESKSTQEMRPPRVGIIGQVSHAKGHDTLLQAMRILHDQGILVEVHVFGLCEGAFFLEMSRLVQEYELTKHWKWMGYASEVFAIYLNIDIAVVPSRCFEAFGMSAAEASAYRLPVVASNRGALGEVVRDGKTGFLFDPNDPGQLAAKIKWLVDYPHEARQMGIEGQNYVFTEFKQERMISQFEDLFRQFTASNRPGGSPHGH